MIDDAPDPGVHRPAAVVGGMILLALGALLLVDRTLPARMGELTAPFVLIVLGTTMIFGKRGVMDGRRISRPDGRSHRPRVRRSGMNGAWLIGIGAWMLVSQAHVFGLSFHTSWPLLLIMAGMLIVVRGWE